VKWANHTRINLLFDRKIVEDVVEQGEHRGTNNPINLALVNAVLALGFHYLNLQEDFITTEKPPYDPLEFFDRALKARDQLVSGEISIRNLQVR
jgi:hypothetical protein